MNKIVIAGTGSAAYLSVALLHKNTSLPIIWYRPSTAPIGVGEGTLPVVMGALRELGISFDDVLTKLNGSVKYGVKFKDFGYVGNDFNFPFGAGGPQAERVNQLIDSNSQEVDLSVALAVHFDIELLYKFFDENVLAGMERLQVIDGELDYATADITDAYVIDATGFAKAIVSTLPDYAFTSFNHLIQNDQAYVYRRAYTDVAAQKRHYTTAIAQDYGWIWNIPLGDKIGVGYVHSSAYDVADSFVDYLRAFHSDPAITKENLRLIKFNTGRNSENGYVDAGRSNIVFAVGLASSFIEPMEATGIALAVYELRSISKLISGEIDLTSHNATVHTLYDTNVSFIAAHYATTERAGPYWDACRALPASVNVRPEGSPWGQYAYEAILSGLRKDKL